MPDDLSLASEARRLTGASLGWEIHLRRWEIYFAVIGALTLVLAWTTETASIPERIVSTGLILALAAWWLVLGRPMFRGDGAGSLGGFGYAAGVLVLFVPLVALTPNCSWLLFSLSVQSFIVLSRQRDAVTVVVVLNAVPAVIAAIQTGISADFWQNVAIGAGVSGVATLINWITEDIARRSDERQRLIEALQASRAEVADLSRQAGASAERDRLAAEIHDTLAQGFTSILTLVQAAGGELDRDPDRARTHLDLAARTARENLGEARALVASLTPAALDSGSLTEALRRQALRLTEECGIAAEFRTDFGDADGPRPLPTAIEVVLLRTAQETLANARRHSGARQVVITLGGAGERVWLSVADDGIGFDPAAPTTGFGLRGMRKRVEQVGGRVTVDSGRSGTTVRVEVCGEGAA